MESGTWKAQAQAGSGARLLAWLMAARLLEAAVPWGRGRWVQALVLLGTPAAAVLALPAWWLLRRWRRSDAVLLAVMLKLFLYGGLVWLAVRVKVRWTMATLGVVALALAIGMAQTHLPGRSAEVTDAVLAFGTALALRAGLRARDGRV